MGADKIRYFVYSKGRWKWQPTKAMRVHGFNTVKMGRGGPALDPRGYPAASTEDKFKAVRLNDEWDAARLGLPQRPTERPGQYPPGSVGDGYQRAMALRKAARVTAGETWTREQESRDSWPRAWKWIGPEFGDCDPRTIEPEHFIAIGPDGKAKGLIPKVEKAVSPSERHLVIKIWRALWQRMGSMKYCDRTADPSRAFVNTTPDGRQDIWHRKEVLKLVQIAWRNDFKGLAACMAVVWDSMLSPIDGRKLTLAQAASDGFGGVMFGLARAKTGKAAAATLSPWSLAILVEYMAGLPFTLHPDTPIFHTRGGQPGPKGGRPRPPAPYTKDMLSRDFAKVRELAFGEEEDRKISDMRRSGAVEGDAGGGSLSDQANKMANTVATNNRLRKVYNPVNVASVRRFDQARAAGAKVLEQNPAKSISGGPNEILFQKREPAKPLK
jgi:hypothetical protein